MYGVIVGDIVNSRSIDNEVRNEITLQAKDTFERINSEYSDCLLAQFSMVRGDSFEGVLSKRYSSATKIVQDIIKAFYRVERTVVRICIALGELSFVSSTLNETDGPAFHKAVDILTMMKKTGNSHWLQVSIDINGIESPLIHSYMELLSALTRRWSDKQREVVWAVQENKGYQKAVGEKFGIAYSVVSRQLKVANYEIYCNAWDNLTEYLTRIEGNRVS